MAEYNTGKIDLLLRDVHGDFLSDEITLEFRNQRLASLDFRQTVRLQGKKLTLEGVKAFPYGMWLITVIPGKFRHKSVFVNVPAGGTATISETFFVDPARVTPILPTPEDLRTEARWNPLAQRIQKSAKNGITFETLENEQKAGLLNLYAKMRAQKVDDKRDVFGFVTEIFEIKPARMFARVKAQLWNRVRRVTQGFHLVPGVLHDFPTGWDRLEKDGSFKTPDRMGNLQLTFARGKQRAWAADIDIDDHKGAEHAFDVIKHKLTGRDTHPYDIHQILVFFQGLDPGYRFA